MCRGCSLAAKLTLFLTEKQKTEKEDTHNTGTENVVPSDFIWGRTDVQRNISGKLIPRTRQLYQLDYGTAQNNYGTYFSIADKLVRLPTHRPARGIVQSWYSEGLTQCV